jgi:hypothetical protein
MLPDGGHELAETWRAQEFCRFGGIRPATSTDSPGVVVSCNATFIGASPTSTAVAAFVLLVGLIAAAGRRAAGCAFSRPTHCATHHCG